VFPFTQGFGWVASLALQVLWSAAVGFGAGSLTTTVVMQKPEVRGTVMSLNSSFMNGSIVLGGVLSGYLVHTSDGSYSAVGAMSAIAALLVFALIPAIPKPSGK
jgi:predicted MFS family arabinose efflux permease